MAKWYKTPSAHDESPEHQAACWNPWCRERLRLAEKAAALLAEEVSVEPPQRAVVIPAQEPELIVILPRYPWKHLHCWYCGIAMEADGVRRKSRDHAIPLSRGGSNDDSNIVVCCQVCNCDKGSLTLEEYRCVIAFRNDANHKEFKFWRERTLTNEVKSEAKTK